MRVSAKLRRTIADEFGEKTWVNRDGKLCAGLGGSPSGVLLLRTGCIL